MEITVSLFLLLFLMAFFVNLSTPHWGWDTGQSYLLSSLSWDSILLLPYPPFFCLRHLEDSLLQSFIINLKMLISPKDLEI